MNKSNIQLCFTPFGMEIGMERNSGLYIAIMKVFYHNFMIKSRNVQSIEEAASFIQSLSLWIKLNPDFKSMKAVYRTSLGQLEYFFQ